MQSTVSLHASHIPERVGLFTIIVLGETVLAVVLGADAVDWNLGAAASSRSSGSRSAPRSGGSTSDYLDAEMVLGRSIFSGPRRTSTRTCRRWPA